MIFIATPCYDAILLEHHMCVVNLIGYLSAKSIPYQYATLSDCNSMRSRAEMTETFMRSGMEYMLQIDSDMTFKPSDVMRLLSHKLPIVAGVYRKRKMDWDKVVAAIKMDDPNFAAYAEYTFVVDEEDTTMKNNVIKVKYAPTGFLMFHRDVIAKMINDHPETKFKSPNQGEAHALYDNIIKDGQYLSTDYSFCERATRSGFSIYADLSLKLDHVGLYVYESNPSVLVKPRQA
jgi:hypothetical protein